MAVVPDPDRWLAETGSDQRAILTATPPGNQSITNRATRWNVPNGERAIGRPNATHSARNTEGWAASTAQVFFTSEYSIKQNI